MNAEPKKYFSAVLGIDPGLDGGLALVEFQSGALRWAIATPTVNRDDTSSRRALDLDAIVQIVQELRRDGELLVGIERQHPMPRQGLASTFQTGRGFGQYEGLLKASRTPFLASRAKDWQVEIPRTPALVENAKDRALVQAMALWPSFDWRASPRCRTAHDGLVDAALIAEATRRKALRGFATIGETP